MLYVVHNLLTTSVSSEIEQLLEFLHQLPAFANMTMSVRRELCGVMVFEVVEQAGTVLLHHKQEVLSPFPFLSLIKHYSGSCRSDGSNS